ncbi:MAG: hypothetical protein EAZ55_05295 [Cytophagales bacterium]|nr:MAG: hypothetical protein EAZ55_05295 [Cytophagales bacterium]
MERNDSLTNAPEINTTFGWLNTEKQFSIKDFRGKIVLLDFWTLGCINCQHIIPDLKRLEKEFEKELIVIGVHSAKFHSEKRTEAIRKAILKFGIKHLVVNDADSKIWDAYTVRAWPTVILINPEGKIVYQRSGESFYKSIRQKIQEIIKEKGDKINKNLLSFQLEEAKEAKSILRFPSKMVSDGKGYFYISDSGNNRILKTDIQGNIITIVGNGKEGLKDGRFSEATFYEPHGLAVKDNWLYVADTKNNVIRLVDFNSQTVRTIAGDGSMGYYDRNEKWNTTVVPNSPWDVLIHENSLYVANAGNHQILRLELKDAKLYRFAGAGNEALTDGTTRNASFNQPSGLTLLNDILYVADSEASAVRGVALKNNQVFTLIGKGLFEFGDKDGAFSEALLQHCMSVKAHPTLPIIYVADTYNGKIKEINLTEKTIKTLVDNLEEPNDVLFYEGSLYISNTHAHEIVRYELSTGKRSIWALQSNANGAAN